MLCVSIFWTACPNLLVMFKIDSSSRLRMVCSELMFPFCRTEHKYGSSREFMDPGQSGSFQASREYLAQKTIVPCVEDHRFVEVHHMVVQVRGAVIHSERWYDEAIGQFISLDMLP